MKNKLTLLLSAIVLTIANVSAQDAKAILDELSQKAADYTSMEASFTYTMLNKADDINEKQNGKIITSGDKYNLEIAGQQIISDGETVWTVIVDAEEVQISNVPDEEEEEMEEYISPNKILTLWENGFKYKYESEKDLNGTTVHVINLYPEDPSEKSFHTIKLFIDKTKMELVKIQIKGKDGTDYTYLINSFQVNQTFPDSKFKFSNPKFDVIDLR